MLNEQKRRWLIPLLVAIFILICDQGSKRWILHELGPEPLVETIPLIGDWFRLIFSQNTGVAFNLFQNLSPIFIITSLVIGIGAFYIYWVHIPNRNLFVQISIGLIEGGALGNLIDRITVGYVIDFIQVGWWPIFNIADSAISVGAVILALYLIFMEDEQKPPRRVPQDDAFLKELLNSDLKSSRITAPPAEE